jgi:hypothetical protein
LRTYIALILILAFNSSAGHASASDDTLFSKYNISLDYGFTSEQRHSIASAIGHIPTCYRKNIVGMKLRNNTNLRWSDGHDCLPGHQISTVPPILELNASCGFTSELALHEIFHIVGNRGLQVKYQISFKTFPNCPVSSYSAWYQGRSLSEDFAEASRLVSTKHVTSDRRQPCVTAKLQALKIVMDQCE